MNIPDINNLTTNQRSATYIKSHFLEFYQYLNETYPDQISIPEKLYWYYNGLNDHPKCKICGKDTKFINSTRGYREYCCSKCARNDVDIIDKMKLTCLKKYGHACSLHGNDIHQIIIKNNLKKYGFENPMQSQMVKDKLKATNIERYGVSCVLRSDDIIEKGKLTRLKKYGDENYTNRKKSISTRRQNTVEKTEDLLGYTEEGYYIKKCPHLGCDKCTEKKYITIPVIHKNRENKGCELCTHLLPIDNNSNKNTSIEIFVRDILDKYNISYITNDRNTINPLELDIYIPSHNLAIECNGIFWHSDLQKDREYHFSKYQKCEEKEIQLLTIWEDQIYNNPDIIESIILSKLGIYKKRVYARQCAIKNINSKECEDFLNKNHLQGSIYSSVRLGLYYQDKLVSVMTFGKKRACMKGQGQWEMYRFCNSLNMQVIGGASKLLNHFIRYWNPTLIESFSNNDISTGKLYKILGFDKISSSIGYWYIKNMKRYHRSKFMKHNLIQSGYDPNKTESEIMKDLEYLKIYDSGQSKWILNI